VQEPKGAQEEIGNFEHQDHDISGGAGEFDQEGGGVRIDEMFGVGGFVSGERQGEGSGESGSFRILTGLRKLLFRSIS